MKRSLDGSLWSLCTLGSLYFITLKKSTLITSAMELQEVGWPDLLAAVILMLWMRSLVERSLNTLASSRVGWWYRESAMVVRRLKRGEVGGRGGRDR